MMQQLHQIQIHLPKKVMLKIEKFRDGYYVVIVAIVVKINCKEKEFKIFIFNILQRC